MLKPEVITACGAFLIGALVFIDLRDKLDNPATTPFLESLLLVIAYFTAAYAWFTILCSIVFPTISPFWHWATAIAFPVLPAALIEALEHRKTFPQPSTATKTIQEE